MVPDDDAILQATASGSPESVAACVRCFAPMIYSMARQAFGQRAATEDAVQDVFIELWKHAGRFDPNIAPARAFVASIAKRRIIDRVRSEMSAVRKLETTGDQAPEAIVPRGAGEAEAWKTMVLGDDPPVAALRKALADLPFEQQSAIKLSVVDGLAHQAIAERLGLPLGTVKSHLRRGIAKLRGMMGVDGDADSSRTLEVQS